MLTANPLKAFITGHNRYIGFASYNVCPWKETEKALGGFNKIVGQINRISNWHSWQNNVAGQSCPASVGNGGY